VAPTSGVCPSCGPHLRDGYGAVPVQRPQNPVQRPLHGRAHGQATVTAAGHGAAGREEGRAAGHTSVATTTGPAAGLAGKHGAAGGHVHVEHLGRRRTRTNTRARTHTHTHSLHGASRCLHPTTLRHMQAKWLARCRCRRGVAQSERHHVQGGGCTRLHARSGRRAPRCRCATPPPPTRARETECPTPPRQTPPPWGVDPTGPAALRWRWSRGRGLHPRAPGATSAAANRSTEPRGTARCSAAAHAGRYVHTRKCE
jgi:hypothetical protein